MKKEKPTHYTSVLIQTKVAGDEPNIEVRIATFTREEPIGRFWVPRSCLMPKNRPTFVPREILQSRALRDLNITFDQYAGRPI